MKKKKEVTLYNAMLILILIVLEWYWLPLINLGFFVYFSLILVILSTVFKIENKKAFYRRNIVKLTLFNLLAYSAGCFFNVAVWGVEYLVYEFNSGMTMPCGDELYNTVPSFVVSVVLLYVFNYFITFKKIDKKQRIIFSAVFAVFAAPYTLFISRYFVVPAWR